MTCARHQHRHALPIPAVFLAEHRDQITFLKLDGNDNVSRRHGREEQMSSRHAWGRPERDDETKVNRMSHQPIEHGGAKAWRGHRTANEIVRDLMQSEEFEMVD